MTQGGQRWRTAVTTLRVVARRPALWGEAAATVRRLAPPGWWRRPPFLPLPDPTYWAFRMHTAYGDDLADRPTENDVIEYLRWCQRVRPGPR